MLIISVDNSNLGSLGKMVKAGNPMVGMGREGSKQDDENYLVCTYCGPDVELGRLMNKITQPLPLEHLQSSGGGGD